MTKKETIGLRIRTMRQSRKMTQADLANAINQSQSSITMYETGRREPDFETLEALADVFNIPLVYLMIDPESDMSDEEKKWSTYVQERIDSPVPQTSEARIMARGIDRLPQAEREQALAVVRAMFQQHSDYFKEREDESEL